MATDGQQSPNKPATGTSTAAPRRGKFLSPPVATAPAATSTPSKTDTAPTSTGRKPSPSGSKSRGKFLGGGPTGTTSSSCATTGVIASGSSALSVALEVEDESHPSLATLRSHVATAKIDVTKRRKLLGEKREQVFKNLEEAENIVLGLLHCASEVSGALRDMTTARAGGVGGEGEKNGNDNGNKNNNSFEDLSAQVRSNGVGYLAGVKKLHQLLAPHAELVKSYRNHDREGSLSSLSKSKETTPDKKMAATATKSTAAAIKATANAKPSTAAKSTLKATAKSPTPKATPASSGALPTQCGEKNQHLTISGQIIEKATSNMYAARVEKRLAMERNEILKEMLRLETSESERDPNNGEVSPNLEEGGDMVGTKRKLESMDQQ